MGLRDSLPISLTIPKVVKHIITKYYIILYNLLMFAYLVEFCMSNGGIRNLFVSALANIFSLKSNIFLYKRNLIFAI